MTPDPSAVISTPSSALEDLKHKFLVALYLGQPPRALRCYHAILEAAGNRELSETDEKHLRQVQEAVKKIHLPSGSGKIPDDRMSPLTHMYTTLQSLLRDRARYTLPQYLSYETWEADLNLSPWQRDLLFQTAITFQLTSGCSNFCRRCNEWALPRVRGHFSRQGAEKILHALLELGNLDLALYGGSDPLDWEDDGFSLGDLLQDLRPGTRFSLLTKLPRGREGRLKALVEQGVDIGVSLTNRNRGRIQALETKMGTAFTKQHATPDLLIPACLDEDFSSVKPSITDSYGTEISLDGAFIIIPTFTSALYPFGHKKIPVTKATLWFPVKKIGRPALLQDYFKPLEVTGPDGKPYFLDHLLDVQVENILVDNGDYDLTPPGMRSVKEYFEIFDEKARLKRRSMTLSVMRRLKKEYLADSRLGELAPDTRNRYLEKVQSHLDFSRKNVVNQARVCAAAFFLNAIRAYIRANPVKREILVFLTREEYDNRKKGMHLPVMPPLSGLFADPGTDAWALFRYQALSLVHGQASEAVEQFVSDRPAVFDPARDRFALP